MIVTKLSKSESSEKEFVFETSPPLTDQVLFIFNQRTRDSSQHFKNRDGKLVISAAQMQEIVIGRWSKEPAKVFSEILTEIEDELAAQAAAREQSRKSQLARTAKFFGVPLE